MKLGHTAWLQLAVCIVLACTATAYADTITLRSGNAAVGQADPLITVRGVGITLPDGGSVLPANISPRNALMVARPAYWFAPPAGCQWITPNSWAGGGYVYETTFQLPTGFAGARLTLGIGNDDWAAMFLNGRQISGWDQSGFASLYTFTFNDPSGFVPGANLLQFYVGNGEGSPTGVLFRGSVEYQPAPEPSSLVALLCGIGGLSGFAIRKRE